MDEKKEKLFDFCQTFVNDMDIYCSETIYQTDRVIENAYEFIEGICDIVGYAELDEE